MTSRGRTTQLCRLLCRRSHTTASSVRVFDELTAVGIDTVECDLVVGVAFSEPEKLNCHNVIQSGDLACVPLGQVFPEYQKDEDG
jgi:hypothetical protein